MEILVTGTAGFIGYHLVKRLLRYNDLNITGIDNINDYYDVQLKYDRLADSGIMPGKIHYGEPVTSLMNGRYNFIKLDLCDAGGLESLFTEKKFDAVINLAAQAGVRYSLVNPKAYIDSNITGFFNLLECCRNHKARHFIYASSSSVYGLNEKIPFDIEDKADQPISLYAASKKSNELMAHAYSHLFGLQTTGLRFFTVYGPWGRPDMALYKFTKAIVQGEPIQIYNNGKMMRDFTYIDDIVDGIEKVFLRNRQDKSLSDPDRVRYSLYNLGRGEPVDLMEFVNELENNLGIPAIREFLPLQNGDVANTWADLKGAGADLQYSPSVSVSEGVREFVKWYREYYKVGKYLHREDVLSR